MSVLRGMVGATLGAAVAGIALRVRVIARERDASIGEVIADLPNVLSEDASRVVEAARHAVEDGRVAAHEARIEFDEQVAARSRRTKGNDV